MFVLLNDGSSFSDKGTLAADRMLLQRSLVLTLQRCGMPVVLLNGLEFRDSKVRSQVLLGSWPNNLYRYRPSSSNNVVSVNCRKSCLSRWPGVVSVLLKVPRYLAQVAKAPSSR